MAQAPHLLLGGGADHRLDRVVEQAVRAGARLDPARRATLADLRFSSASRRSEKPIAFSRRSPAASPGRPSRQIASSARDDLVDPLEEPGIVSGDRVDLGDAEPLAQRLGGDQQPVRASAPPAPPRSPPWARRRARAPRRGRSARSRARAAPFAGSRGSCGRSPSPRRPTSSRSRAAPRLPLNFSKAKRGILVTT